MLKTVKDACTPHPNAFDWAAANQVEDLDRLVEKSSNGRSFFAVNHVTQGMRTLFELGLRRLAGKNDQALFELLQAMGGGKTHTMVAFGLLARDDDLRQELFPQLASSAPFQDAHVVAFSGRRYPDHFFWGEIALQLGKTNAFAKYWKSGPVAPDELAWMELLGDTPTLILLDELPPYFDNALTRTVGSGTLATVATAALANLFAAALKLPRLCIVVSNLSGTYEGASRKLHRAVKDVIEEAHRQSKPITPVELGGDEVFQILRKRLFAALPVDHDVEEVVQAFARSIKEAEKAKSISKSAEQIADEIRRSYPFHPAIKDIVALFRENESFRQTRGLFQFVSRLIRSVWKRKTNDVHLMGLQHLDLRDAEVRDELKRISDLTSAIAKDVCAGDGASHAEVIDAEMQSDAGSQVATLLLSASLSKSVDAVRGMTKQRLLECLIAPLRAVHEFSDAFEHLRAAAWYLHKDERETFYFSNTENLTKRLEEEAKRAPLNKIEAEMRRRLESIFRPKERAAYEAVHALPKLDDIKLQGARQLLILSPDTRHPPEEARSYFEGVVQKNNLCVLTGDGSDLASLEQRTRRLYALAKLKAELPKGSPLFGDLEELDLLAEVDFWSTITASFNRLWYPAKKNLQYAKLAMNFHGNDFDGERQIQATLVKGAKKLVLDLDADASALLQRAEDILWPQNQKKVPWRDIKDRALSQTRWLWLRPNGLEQLRKIAEQQDRWRYTEDGYIERGPFKKPQTSVSVSRLHYDPETGEATLEVSPIHAGTKAQIVKGKTDAISPNSEKLTEFRFQTREPRLCFIAVDPSGEHEVGPPVVWTNELTITHQPKPGPAGKRTVELRVVPQGKLRYTMTGANPAEGTHYTGPFEISAAETRIWVWAEADSVTEKRDFTVPASGDDRVHLDPKKPVKVKSKFEVPGTKLTFELVTWSKQRSTRLVGVAIEVGDGTKIAKLRFPSDIRIEADHVEKLIADIRVALGEDTAEARLSLQGVDLKAGVDFEEFQKLMGVALTQNEVSQ